MVYLIGCTTKLWRDHYETGFKWIDGDGTADLCVFRKCKGGRSADRGEKRAFNGCGYGYGAL